MDSSQVTVPCKIWRPDGPPYKTTTCTTHEEIAGSLVADGMPEAEYWPLVVAGYRATIKHHNERAAARMRADYAQGWVVRILDYMGGNND